MENAYTFSDVMFVPKYSDIRSRSEVNLLTRLGILSLNLPVISANMKDITEDQMVMAMIKNGGLGILHRFMSIEENVEMFKRCAITPEDGLGTTFATLNSAMGVSVGVGEKEKERFHALYRAGARTFCIDVAHGHHINVKEMLEHIKCKYSESWDIMTVIVGNVASVEGALDLYAWGARVIKVGVGPGSCCQTRENTGVGVPQLYILKKIYEALPKDAYIISDGGIKKTGDIAKALLYSNAVMMGGFFAGATETPGHVYKDMKGDLYKTMAGSASAESKVRSGNDNSFVEGGIRQVPFKGKIKYICKEIRENVQSSFSYSGARNIDDFREKAELIKISGGGKQESKL